MYLKNKKPTLKIFIFLCILTTFGLLLKTQNRQPSSPNLPTKQNQSTEPKSIDQSVVKNSNNSKAKINSASISQPTKPQPHKHNSPTLQIRPAHPQIPYYLLGTTNDPQFPNTWFHNKIQTNRAWDLSTGSATVTVAVIDTGFELNHEDLANKWFKNNNEMGLTQVSDICWTGTPTEKSTNNCDDDQNGYVDDWQGYDFFYVDNNPQAGQINPNGEATRHGTMVAGAVGATANNSKGSAGVDQQTKILPLQVFSDDGEAYTDDIASAIDYATDMNAKVINLSLGSNQYDDTLLSAINRAQNSGVLVVAASGNCALNDEEFCNSLTAPGRMVYPALYPQVLAVGATDSNDQRASFSSYGPQLDVVAPGSSISPLPVYNNGGLNYYATASGTSFASPIVAGLASLLIAQSPEITITELTNSIITSTDTTAEMNNQPFTNEYGYGRVNAHKATLLGLAKSQTQQLGSEMQFANLPPVGAVWRANADPIANDEWLLFGCRVFQSDTCSVILTNGSNKYTASSLNKADQIRYLFIKGSAMTSGNWQASAHSHEFASAITTLTKN